MVALQRASGGKDQSVLHNPMLNNCRPRGAQLPAFNVNFWGYLNVCGNFCPCFVMSRFILICSVCRLCKWGVLLITF